MIVTLRLLSMALSMAHAVPPPPPPAATADPMAPEVAPSPTPDRSKPPPVKDPPVLPVPEPELHELAPGVTARFVRVPGVRKVGVSVILQAGMVEQDGRSSPLGEGAGYLADAAAGPYDSSALQELEDLNEIDVASYLGQHEGGVSLTAPLDALPKGLELLSLVLREPSFPKTEVKRYILDQNVYFTVSGPSSQAALSRAAMAYAWFPADHPYGVRPDLRAISGIDAKALSARWDRAIHESPITVLVVGDVAWSAVEGDLKKMAMGLGRAGPPPKWLAVTPPKATRVVVVDLPGQSQVAVRARWNAPSFGEPDKYAVSVANFFLGGAFLSRLNLNLREEKGFTYGARSSYGMQQTYGMFTVSVDVKAENLGATITEIKKELHQIGAAPGTEEELLSARRAFAADWNRTLQTADTAMAAYEGALARELTMTEWRAWTERLQAVTLAEVQDAARKWFADDAPVVWVLVGDAAAIKAQLEPLGIQAEVVGPESAMLGTF